MFVIFDYSCPCLGDEFKEERLVDKDEQDNQLCGTCGKIMVKEIPAPRGRVRGSEFRVRQ